jgi:acyl dehydratase
MATTQGFNATAIGKWTEPVGFAITRERLKAYAAATNDVIEPHRSGDYGSPVFATVPAYAPVSRALIRAIPGHLLMMVVPGEQDFHFHAPLLPDTTVVTRAAAIAIRPAPHGVGVTVEAQTHDDDGRLLVRQFTTSFIRGASVADEAGAGAPDHRFDESLRDRVPDAIAAQTFDRDQAYRYAAASGDPMPIYTDDELARSLGLPGAILHGPCAMASISVAVIRHACPEDPTRLKRLAARFACTIRPGQRITTRIWDEDSTTFAYESESEEGRVVVADGLAEVMT